MLSGANDAVARSWRLPYRPVVLPIFGGMRLAAFRLVPTNIIYPMRDPGQTGAFSLYRSSLIS